MRHTIAATWVIAKRDLSSFFYSPKGMAIFYFFLIFMGLFFSSAMQTFVEIQQRASMTGGQVPTVEELFSYVFSNMHFILMLVVPAVTMASFSEEIKSYTIRLTQTAPVRPISVVLGKFLASLMMMSLVLLATSVFPLFAINYGDPEISVILSAYLGMFLLIGLQLSLGIWISSMTKHQFMAFIFTMFGLFFMLILNYFAPKLSGGGVSEEFLRYIAVITHLESMFKGLVTTKDVMYFLCLTSMFLFFTNIVLDSRRWR